MPSEQDRRRQFVQQYLPYAIEWGRRLGVPPEALLAIGASESNYGAAGSIFGIKGASPSGQSRTYQTWEMVNGKPVTMNDTFAVYNDPNEGFQHFANLVQSGRYKPAFDYLQQSGDWKGWLQRVNQAGYATDPQWANKIANIATSSITPLLPETLPESPLISGQRTAATTTQGGGAVSSPATTTTAPAPTSTIRTTLLQMDQTLSQQLADAEAALVEMDRQIQADPSGQGAVLAATQRGGLVTQIAQLRTSRLNVLKEINDLDANGSGGGASLSDVAGIYTAAGNLRAASNQERRADQQFALDSRAQTFNENIANQQLAVTQFGTFVDLVDKTFQGSLGLSALYQQMLQDTEANRQAAVQLAMQQGQLDLAGATAYVDAAAKQQMAEIARAGEVLARAQFIDAANFRNATRMLPKDIGYIPGFEPSGAMNAVAERLGLPPTIIKATPIDPAQIDPTRALQTAEGTLPAVPSFGANQVQQVANANKGLNTYTPREQTAESIHMPSVPNWWAVADAYPQMQPMQPFVAPVAPVTGAYQDLEDEILGLLTPPPAAPPAAAGPGIAAASGEVAPVTPQQQFIQLPGGFTALVGADGQTMGVHQAATGAVFEPSGLQTAIGRPGPGSTATTVRHGSVDRAMPGVVSGGRSVGGTWGEPETTPTPTAGPTQPQALPSPTATPTPTPTGTPVPGGVPIPGDEEGPLVWAVVDGRLVQTRRPRATVTAR